MGTLVNMVAAVLEYLSAEVELVANAARSTTTKPE